MKGIVLVLTLVVTVPTVAAGFSIKGGYQLAVGPQDDIASQLGFFAGVEQALGPVSLDLEYAYADYDWNRLGGYDFIPEDSPIFGWRCHALNVGAEYPIFTSRVSPFVSGGVGAVWYDYDITEYGLWEIPDIDLAFAVSLGGGVNVQVRRALTLFVKSSYERHFTKLMDIYHHGTGEAEYTNIEFSGLNIKTGMSVGIL